MKFFGPLCVLAVASVALAQSKTLFFSIEPSEATAGRPLTVKYVAPDMNKPVKIILRRGEAAHLTTIATLTDSATDGSYTWTPARSLSPGHDYALEIMQGSEINYTKEFAIVGSEASSSPTRSSSSTDAAHSKSLQSSMPSIMPHITAPANQTTMTSIMSASSMNTIPMSRNATFVTPTPAASPTESQAFSSTLGGMSTTSSAPVPTGNDASTLGGPLTLTVGAVLFAIAKLC